MTYIEELQHKLDAYRRWQAEINAGIEKAIAEGRTEFLGGIHWAGAECATQISRLERDLGEAGRVPC